MMMTMMMMIMMMITATDDTIHKKLTELPKKLQAAQDVHCLQKNTMT